ncbi:unnamed protein product [Closterium sp. Naga37s-1]|nr:unnamed protein product [Closterium sp. Naga37s-1]
MSPLSRIVPDCATPWPSIPLQSPSLAPMPSPPPPFSYSPPIFVPPQPHTHSLYGHWKLLRTLEALGAMGAEGVVGVQKPLLVLLPALLLPEVLAAAAASTSPVATCPSECSPNHSSRPRPHIPVLLSSFLTFSPRCVSLPLLPSLPAQTAPLLLLPNCPLSLAHHQKPPVQKEVVRTFVRSLSSDEGTGVCQGGWWDGWGGCCENGSLRRGEGGNVKGWWDISELYDDCDGNTVSAEVSLGGEMQVRPNAMRLLLGERSIVNLVRMGINRRKFPADEDGVYFVIGNRYSKQWTSLNPWGDNFCRGFCGWHSYRTVKGKRLKYSFVGNPAGRCMWSCGGKTLYNAAAGPSGVGKGMDSVVSTLAHELTESATDPYLATWSDADGYENADVCDVDFTSSDLSTTSDGAPYNLEGIGGSKFLVQKNYHPTQHECVNTV